ncbi:oxidase [Candidatus Gracilibacteria bacterium]|nr:oxidase [Candidatus Gracilibacteria bacterium]
MATTSHSQHSHAQHEPHVSLRTYYTVFAALMVGMLLTIGAYLLNPGELLGLSDGAARAVDILIAMAIAIFKTVLIVLYFMHVRYSSNLVKIFAGAAFFWLLMLFGITMIDYATRDWPQTAPFAPATRITAPAPEWV